MKYSLTKKSGELFPLTDPINAYVTIRRTNDELHRFVSKKLAQWDLSVPKYGVLKHLFDHEPCTLSELSGSIFSGNSNMTTLIDRMEKDHLLKRTADSRDRRSKKVHLTAKGRELIPKIISEYRSFLHQMMVQCVTPDEQRQLIDLLSKIRGSIQNQKSTEKNSKN